MVSHSNDHFSEHLYSVMGFIMWSVWFENFCLAMGHSLDSSTPTCTYSLVQLCPLQHDYAILGLATRHASDLDTCLAFTLLSRVKIQPSRGLSPMPSLLLDHRLQWASQRGKHQRCFLSMYCQITAEIKCMCSHYVPGPFLLPPREPGYKATLYPDLLVVVNIETLERHVQGCTDPCVCYIAFYPGHSQFFVFFFDVSVAWVPGYVLCAFVPFQGAHFTGVVYKECNDRREYSRRIR